MVKNEAQLNNIEKLLEEAETNFGSGRYRDAAKGFEYIVDKCIDSKKYDDMYYFVYRALSSWSLVGDDQRIVNLLQQVGIDSLKLSTLHAVNTANSTETKKELVELLYKAQENLKSLNEKENRMKMIISLIETYFTLVNDPTCLPKFREEYLRKIIILSEEIKDNDIENEARNSLAIHYTNEANYQLKNGIYDKEKVYSHLLMKAAHQYQRANNFQMVLSSVENAKEIDSEFEISKYPEIDIPSIKADLLIPK